MAAQTLQTVLLLDPDGTNPAQPIEGGRWLGGQPFDLRVDTELHFAVRTTKGTLRVGPRITAGRPIDFDGFGYVHGHAGVSNLLAAGLDAGSEFGRILEVVRYAPMLRVTDRDAMWRMARAGLVSTALASLTSSPTIARQRDANIVALAKGERAPALYPRVTSGLRNQVLLLPSSDSAPERAFSGFRAVEGDHFKLQKLHREWPDALLVRTDTSQLMIAATPMQTSKSVEIVDLDSFPVPEIGLGTDLGDYGVVTELIYVDDYEEGDLTDKEALALLADWEVSDLLDVVLSKESVADARMVNLQIAASGLDGRTLGPLELGG